MTAAGVQNLEPAAHLPPPPSGAQAAGSAGKPAADPQFADQQTGNTPGERQDFRSELERQDTRAKETKSAGRTGTAPGNADSAKPGSAKSGKPRDKAAQDPNLSVVTPVQAAEPPKPIQPIVLALAMPQENVAPGETLGSADNVKLAEVAKLYQHPDESTQIDPAQIDPAQIDPAQKDSTQNGSAQSDPPRDGKPAPALPNAADSPLTGPPLSAPPVQSADSSQPEAPPVELPPSSAAPQSGMILRSTKPPQSAKDQAVDPAQPSAGNGLPSATPNASAVQISPVVAEVPVPPETAQAGDQSTEPAQTTESSDRQPASRAELRPSDAALEPAVTAVHKTLDPAPSSPAPLAFAARMAAVTPKSAEAVPGNQPQPRVSDSPTLAQIPVRYAATAQILQNPGAELKRDAGAAIDRSASADTRTDIVLPRIEPARDAAPSSGPAPSQPDAPPAHMEHIFDTPATEPPAAPPSSSHDIRVRVPDDNGGSTQVRFVESGGEVRVSVRTTDDALAQNLRSHLNDLTQRLGDAGIPAEIWKPGAAAASSQNNQHQPDREGRGSGGQQSGGQGGQHDRQQKRPAWLEEMETSLHGTNQ